MRVPLSVQSGAGNLAAIVDVSRPLKMKRGPGRNERIQVEDRAILPKKCAGVAVKGTARKGRADNLSFRIYCRRKAARVLIYRSKISDLAQTLPKRCMVKELPSERSNPCDLSSLIECFSCCLIAANGAAQVSN